MCSCANISNEQQKTKPTVVTDSDRVFVWFRVRASKLCIFAGFCSETEGFGFSESDKTRNVSL